VNGVQGKSDLMGEETELTVTRRVISGIESRIGKELSTKMGGEISDLKIGKRMVRLRTERGSLLKLCRLLRDAMEFDHLSLLSAVDWNDRFEVVYHIFSYTSCCTVEIKVSVPKDDPKIDSVTPLWEGANWHEREAYDMMGIVFTNHPDPRRILLPQEYEYFPLRKDFKMDLE